MNVPLDEAIDEPRIHHHLTYSLAYYETDFAQVCERININVDNFSIWQDWRLWNQCDKSSAPGGGGGRGTHPKFW